MSVASLASPRPDLKVVPFTPDDDALVRGMKEGESWASRLLVERYGPIVERILRRTLGIERHTEIVDVVHEVFAEALSSVSRLRDSVALLAWLKRISVHTAYRTMRRRRARAWLRFSDPSELPPLTHRDVDYEARDACQRVYRVLERLPIKEQLVFSLRYFDGMELTELADACDVSLSTIKRRRGFPRHRADACPDLRKGSRTAHEQDRCSCLASANSRQSDQSGALSGCRIMGEGR